jgi:hypothetical protein
MGCFEPVKVFVKNLTAQCLLWALNKPGHANFFEKNVWARSLSQKLWFLPIFAHFCKKNPFLQFEMQNRFWSQLGCQTQNRDTQIRQQQCSNDTSGSASVQSMQCNEMQRNATKLRLKSQFFSCFDTKPWSFCGFDVRFWSAASKLAWVDTKFGLVRAQQRRLEPDSQFCLVLPGVAISVFLEMMGLAMKQTFAREMNVWG